MTSGCIMVDCGWVQHIDGVVATQGGQPVSGWVGASDRERAPEQWCEPIPSREEWGKPHETWLGLTHTKEDGSFQLHHGSGITWGFTLLFGFIPLSSTTPPEVPVVDYVFIHVHDERGWHSIHVPLTPKQQSKSEPGERWINVGKITLPTNGP